MRGSISHYSPTSSNLTHNHYRQPYCIFNYSLRYKIYIYIYIITLQPSPTRFTNTSTCNKKICLTFSGIRSTFMSSVPLNNYQYHWQLHQNSRLHVMKTCFLSLHSSYYLYEGRIYGFLLWIIRKEKPITSTMALYIVQRDI